MNRITRGCVVCRWHESRYNVEQKKKKKERQQQRNGNEPNKIFEREKKWNGKSTLNEMNEDAKWLNPFRTYSIWNFAVIILDRALT